MSDTVTTWGIALLLLLLALLLGWRSLRVLWQCRRRNRLISAYGLARLNNVVLEDGIGGHKVLEHILLTPDGLLVLLPRHCEGALFGGDNIDSWTQMIGGKSFQFENPLHQLEELLATLRYHLKGIPLEGRVLLSGNCLFPKGRPGRLLLLDEMVREEARVEQAVVPVLQDAWEQLRQQPSAEPVFDDPAYTVSPSRLWLSALMLLLSIAWLGWRLG